jgi:hypothetical protein
VSVNTLGRTATSSCLPVGCRGGSRKPCLAHSLFPPRSTLVAGARAARTRVCDRARAPVRPRTHLGHQLPQLLRVKRAERGRGGKRGRAAAVGVQEGVVQELLGGG